MPDDQMNNVPYVSMSSEQRQEFRKAITSHPNWDAYRRAHDINIAECKHVKMIKIAIDLGIDPLAYGTAKAKSNWGGKWDGKPKPRPYGPEIFSRFQDLMNSLWLSMTSKERSLLADISETIRTKQDCWMTVGQYKVFANIFEEYQNKGEEYNFEHAKYEDDDKVKINGNQDHQKGNHMFDAVNQDETARKLAELLGSIAGNALKPEQIAKIVDDRINEAFAKVPSFKIEIKDTSGNVRSFEGLQHKSFKNLARMAAAIMNNGFPVNIWLSGPAGSGKTHAGQALAKLLGVEFYGMGAKTTSFDVLGYMDGSGTYHKTPFRDAFEHGGVFQADELDSWDNEACMSLQSALANDFCQFPDKIVERHPEFRCIAGANTWGHGATADYVGRAKLDGAFLSRFAKLQWDYDLELEAALSGNKAWAERVQRARQRAVTSGLKVLITPRDTMHGAALIAAGFTMGEAADMTYLAPLSSDQRKIVEG